MEKKPCKTCKKKITEVIVEPLVKENGEVRKNPKLTREITKEDRELMERINKSYTIESDDVKALFKLYRELFNKYVERCNCPGLIKLMIDLINKEL
jgi:hypothetical protein